jgi:acetolactate synthase I/II/III large subunit
MSKTVTVGELVIAFLEQCGVDRAFGVISIHNMPMLDAIGRSKAVRRNDRAKPFDFVTARSEQGAVNMADAYARVRGALGVAISSTGTAAGNTCGALVEALTAGSPVLHLTGQIDSPYLDRNLGFIHEARDQLAMLQAVCKKAYRIASADTALLILQEAVHTALSAPTGPVSIEIPIDVQASAVDLPDDLAPKPIHIRAPDAAAIDALAERLSKARRPLLWLGGGARGASESAVRLVGLGMGAVTSVQGRGIIPETDPRSLAAYHLHGPVESFYRTCDAMLVVGSHLRSNETLKYQLALPKPLYRIDIDSGKATHPYAADLFIEGDAAEALTMLADRLQGRIKIDATFHADLKQARAAAESLVRKGLGPYASLVEGLQAAVGASFLWVRDITISNSTWGNRAPRLTRPYDGVHATGGGIGQGLQMAIGAALAGTGKKTFCLTGDGGLVVNIGEIATLVEQEADVVLIVMNDRGYGVIKNIQDAHYGGRRYFADLHTPDFALVARSVGLSYMNVRAASQFASVIAEAAHMRGPVMVEVDMTAVGPFATAFAGPPARK